MKWITVEKKHYFLQDGLVARIHAQVEHEVERSETQGQETEEARTHAWERAAGAYITSWLERHGDDSPPNAAELDPRHLELAEDAARAAAVRVLDAWCRLCEGRAYEVTYRTPGVLYLITPQLRVTVPTYEVRRIVVEAGTESPTVLVDMDNAVMILGLDTAELSLFPGESRDGP